MFTYRYLRDGISALFFIDHLLAVVDKMPSVLEENNSPAILTSFCSLDL